MSVLHLWNAWNVSPTVLMFCLHVWVGCSAAVCCVRGPLTSPHTAPLAWAARPVPPRSALGSAATPGRGHAAAAAEAAGARAGAAGGAADPRVRRHLCRVGPAAAAATIRGPGHVQPHRADRARPRLALGPPGARRACAAAAWPVRCGNALRCGDMELAGRKRRALAPCRGLLRSTALQAALGTRPAPKTRASSRPHGPRCWAALARPPGCAPDAVQSYPVMPVVHGRL